MLKKLIALIASTLTIVCCGFTNTAQAIPFNKIGNIYFFGDSLSDSGFNDIWGIVPAGKAPTFTTFGGYTWSQYVARDIKNVVLPIYPGPNPADTITNNACCTIPGIVSGTLTGFNYAAAGSTTNSIGFQETWAPSLFSQVQFFLNTPGKTILANDVFFIWEGANDLLAQLGPSTTQLQLLIAADLAAANIAQAVTTLSQHGAKRFVVFSLPNLGRSPLILSFNSPELVASIKNLSFTFDSMINQQLGAVIKQYGVKILYINTYKLLDDVIDASNAGIPYTVGGQSFLFTNTTGRACTAPSAIVCTQTSNGYVFADFVHPTDEAHRLISLQVETEILNWS